MAGILNTAYNGACWISVLKGEVVVDGAASVFLAASFSSLSLRSLISSFMGEKANRASLLLEVAELCLASRWVRISSSLFRPSRSNTLRNSLWAFSVGSFSRDLTDASTWWDSLNRSYSEVGMFLPRHASFWLLWLSG